jgi:hypothetical protein
MVGAKSPYFVDQGIQILRDVPLSAVSHRRTGDAQVHHSCRNGQSKTRQRTYKMSALPSWPFGESENDGNSKILKLGLFLSD